MLFDTTVFIDHLRGNEAATNLFSEAIDEGHELWSSTLVRTEVLAGAAPSELSRTHRLLDRFSWQDVTVTIADIGGKYAFRFRKSHIGVDTVDHVIAATAEFLEASLKTSNVKHFPMVRNLKPAY